MAREENKIKRPNLYIIAGPNGAGKTTFAREFLPNYVKCLEFVNADLIAGGLSPFAPERASIQAGRIMLEQIHSLADKEKDFGFETTLSGRSYLPFLTDLKKQGYQIHLFFLWLRDVKIALDRIASRVRNGGHNIPNPVIRRRFKKSLTNFLKLYRPLLNSWAIFNNSSDSPQMIAFEESGELHILDPYLFETIFK
jgi:predicted ABC-type ATPase